MKSEARHDSVKAGRSAHHYKGPVLLSLFMLAFLSACSNDLVPVDATLSISPATYNTSITEYRDEKGRCLYNPDYYVDIPLVLRLTSADGSPIGDASLSIYVDFAENTFTGIPVLALFDDLNSNGVVDEESELISEFDDDIARLNTDRWTGSRMLLLRINLTCSFRGQVVAFTGGVNTRADIEVVADEVQNSSTDTSEDNS